MRSSILGFFALAAACSSSSGGEAPTTSADASEPQTPSPDAGVSQPTATDAGATASDSPTPSDSATPIEGGATGMQRMNHLVVIVLENWSFDSLYAEFKGAEGLAGALKAPPQIDPTTGDPYATLPQTESHLPPGLPNAPFALDPYLAIDQDTSIDLTTKFYQEHQQIHGGKMDMFVGVSAAKGLTMGYFHTTDLPLAAEAQKYTLCDHFFHGVYGGSLQNHVFLVSAGVMSFPNAPDSLKAVLDANGSPLKNDAGVLQDGPLTPDGFVVGTLFSVNNPHPVGTPPAQLVPAQTMPTVGDSLSAKGVDWAWYAGGWNDAIAGIDAGLLFQYHHQPFVYFANYADGMPGRAHLKDETDFMAAAKAGTLPAVSFVKPAGVDNEHPNYTDVLSGEAHVEDLVGAVRGGPNWNDTAIIVTYDEFGGFWDHVPPPSGDRWGPGTRIPTMVISPLAKPAFVDSTVYDTSSILALIEHRWALAPLGTRDSAANDMSNVFAP